MAAVPVSVDPGARAVLASRPRGFSAFPVVDATLEEDRAHRGVAVALVEAQGEELGVHQDAPHPQPPGLRLELGEEQASHAGLPMGLEHRHPADLPPEARRIGGGAGEGDQASGADGVPLGEGQHVVGGGVLGIAFDAFRDVLLLDEDHLADRQRLEQLGLVPDPGHGDGHGF